MKFLNLKAGELTIPDEYQSEISDLTTFNRFLNREYQKFWKVHFAQPKENHQHNVDYLGRYIKRPALANARMEHYDGNVVIFRYLDHKTKQQKMKKQSIDDFNKFAQNSIYLSSQQATRYFGKLPLRVVMRFVFFRSKLRGIRPLANKFAQNSIYLSSQQATRYFGKLPLRVVMRFVFFRSKLRGIRPLAIDRLTQHIPDKFFKMIRYYGFLSYRTRTIILPKIYDLVGQTIEALMLRSKS
ncbi:transposase [Piscirickettsia salmonis]|uniref:transposase n=1 Tax=Piscirickettsia salmonis TaxID=1238 RepID=UPI0012BA86B6|nr:Putative transposase [Piscirickettsia salmonis]